MSDPIIPATEPWPPSHDDYASDFTVSVTGAAPALGATFNLLDAILAATDGGEPPFREKALDGSVVPSKGSPGIEGSVEFARNYDEAVTLINAAASAKGRFKWFKAKGSGSYSYALRKSNLSVYLIVNIHRQSAWEELENPILKKPQAEYLRKDSEEFVRSNGWHFVDTLHYGAELLIVFRLDASSESEKETIAGAVSGGDVLGAFKGSAEFSKRTKKLKDRFKLTISAEIRGVDVPAPTTLTIDAAWELVQAFEKATKDATKLGVYRVTLRPLNQLQTFADNFKKTKNFPSVIRATGGVAAGYYLRMRRLRYDADRAERRIEVLLSGEVGRVDAHDTQLLKSLRQSIRAVQKAWPRHYKGIGDALFVSKHPIAEQFMEASEDTLADVLASQILLHCEFVQDVDHTSSSAYKKPSHKVARMVTFESHFKGEGGRSLFFKYLAVGRWKQEYKLEPPDTDTLFTPFPDTAAAITKVDEYHSPGTIRRDAAAGESTTKWTLEHVPGWTPIVINLSDRRAQYQLSVIGKFTSKYEIVVPIRAIPLSDEGSPSSGDVSPGHSKKAQLSKPARQRRGSR